MIDNLSSKCFAPTNNGQRTTDNGQRTTDNGQWTTVRAKHLENYFWQ
ncbi:hypothetical protein [Anabaena sp. AL93]|nr:hypothetical protein [Anabaena sp. AL93]